MKQLRFKMKQLLKTMLSPMIHLRNLMSSWMFEAMRTVKNKRQRKKKKKK